MSRGPQVQPGRFFSAPLLGGGYAYGYITFVDPAVMTLCDVYDLIAESEAVPQDIESYPLILRDLRIGRSEFRLRPSEEEEFGKRWLLSKRVKDEEVKPHSRFFLMGPRDDRFVYDIFKEHPERSATPEDLEKLQPAGFAFPPVTANTIEVAIRRLDVSPHKFRPEDYPRH